MRYALLLYQDAEFDRHWAEASPEERASEYTAHGRFAELLTERGALLGGDELALSSMATTVNAIVRAHLAERRAALGG